MAGAGGTGGGIIKIICKKLDLQSGGTISVVGGKGGDGNGDDGSNGSGGGGGGGGTIWLMCQEIIGQGIITADGGSGGGGHKGGASGGAGHVRLDYIKSSFSGSIVSGATYGSSVANVVKSNVGGGGTIFYS